MIIKLKNRQIDALTATRGIAALLVVIFHFGTYTKPFNGELAQQFFSKGNLAVSYFFILSGFILCYTYKDKLISYGAYFKRRAARIVPLYLLALFAYAAFMLWQHYKHGAPLGDGFGTALVMDVFFIQSYFPDYAMMINTPGWSLSVEMLFYILFPFALLLYKRNIKIFTAVTILVFIVSQALHVHYVMQAGNMGNRMHNIIYYHPLMHFNQFLMGMLGYYWYTLLEHKQLWLFPLLLFVLIALTAMYMPPVLHNGMLAPLVMLFIVAVAIGQPWILSVKPLVYLGEVSYGIYILQFPVYAYWEKFNFKVTHLGGDQYFYAYLVLLVVASALCYRFIEQPLRRIINRIGQK